MTGVNKMTVSEQVLQERLQRVDGGSLVPQILITITVSIGAFASGCVIGWSPAAKEHIKDLGIPDESMNENFAWIVSMGPLACASGILPWAFLTRKLGPRKTILYQTPLNLLSWFLVAHFNNFESYNTARFFTGFFSICYMYSGEILLTETVHRKYLKCMYAFFRSTVFVGALAIYILGPVMQKHWLCLICGSAVAINSILLSMMPDSPVYLMYENSNKAIEALQYYRGKKEVSTEIQIITQYVNCLKRDSSLRPKMLRAKVVVRALKIIAMLFITRGLTGYYVFIINSTKWFEEYETCVTPYVDNIVFGFILVFARLIGTLLHLYGPFGVKKPMLLSTLSVCCITAFIGFYLFFVFDIYQTTIGNCVTLCSLCIGAISFEFGISMCPEMVCYDYLPFQIYDFVTKIMVITQWIIVFLSVRLHMLWFNRFDTPAALWLISANTLIGSILISLYVIESRGKSLMQLQLELGGNPIGMRGSRRQRIASPMEHINTDTDLKKIIAKHYRSTRRRLTEPA